MMPRQNHSYPYNTPSYITPDYDGHYDSYQRTNDQSDVYVHRPTRYDDRRIDYYDDDYHREPSVAPSDRTVSEFVVANERISPSDSDSREHNNRNNRTNKKNRKDVPEIFVTDYSSFKPPSEYSPSHNSYKTYRSGAALSEKSSVKTKTSRKGGVMIETMSAPNPFCPNTRGVCCLMVLLNLGLILVTLGFVIVLQLFEPTFVWYFGVVFLIVGFLTLMGSLVYCVYICRERPDIDRGPNGQLYWTHHWQKRIELPEFKRHNAGNIDYSDSERHSDHYSEKSGRYSEKSHSKYNERY